MRGHVESIPPATMIAPTGMAAAENLLDGGNPIAPAVAAEAAAPPVAGVVRHAMDPL